MQGRIVGAFIVACLLCVAGYVSIRGGEDAGSSPASRAPVATSPGTVQSAEPPTAPLERRSAAIATAKLAGHPAIKSKESLNSPNWDGMTPSSALAARPEVEAADASAHMLQSWMDSSPPPEDTEDMPIRSAQTLHRTLAQQSTDPKWSESAEAQLRAYLTLMDKDGWLIIVGIHCGDSLCEIQAASRTPETLGQDVDDWNTVVGAMGEQPWWRTYEFVDMSSGSKAGPNGTNLFAVFLFRKVT